MLNFKNGSMTLIALLNPSQRGSRSLPSPIHSTAYWEELQASGCLDVGLVWHHWAAWNKLPRPTPCPWYRGWVVSALLPTVSTGVRFPC